MLTFWDYAHEAEQEFLSYLRRALWACFWLFVACVALSEAPQPPRGTALPPVVHHDGNG
ncbi:hypothetical protein [Acidocella aminolytica]|uniref:Uncharacterized protein n=1 Tax=Acidocella aminolytica 101 = DSM 11237 TaxID=1120923 RepID=A0A0D6PF08_9PROT|nr:hypothetical protein [Acidocella aminolytica]GAN79788.1 hypothetical protein Aam_030_021 [Acidocella aminolytica 101 = DSM 11237]GBQ32052.1 hypothetical protein AA11237_0056 [Acidocella aminolytica 101 = DSM 11237]SHF35568.1 hypothetical protein SAMN02746095_02944 [Acidocella aminolytica 101 = DSM 11237]